MADKHIYDPANPASAHEPVAKTLVKKMAELGTHKLVGFDSATIVCGSCRKPSSVGTLLLRERASGEAKMASSEWRVLDRTAPRLHLCVKCAAEKLLAKDEGDLLKRAKLMQDNIDRASSKKVEAQLDKAADALERKVNRTASYKQRNKVVDQRLADEYVRLRQEFAEHGFELPYSLERLKKSRLPVKESWVDRENIIYEVGREKVKDLEHLNVQDITGIRMDQYTKTPSSDRVGTRNIVHVYNEATPEEKAYWGKWYDYAQANIVRLTKKLFKQGFFGDRAEPKDVADSVEFDLVAYTIAAFSPGVFWDDNLRAATAFFKRYMEGYRCTCEGETERNACACMPNLPTKNRSAIKDCCVLFDDYFAGRPVSIVPPAGPKVGAFFRSIAKPKETRRDIVLDGHAINLWRGNKKRIEAASATPPQRAAAVEDYQTAGNVKLHVDPQSVQSTTWYIWKQGVDIQSAKDEPEEVAAEEAEFAEKVDEEAAKAEAKVKPGKAKGKRTAATEKKLRDIETKAALSKATKTDLLEKE